MKQEQASHAPGPVQQRIKVKLRFCNRSGKQLTEKLFLKAILPALWNPADRERTIAEAASHIAQFNAGAVFFYPLPIDLLKTRLLDLHVGQYAHFPWDMPEEDIYPVCPTCTEWDYREGPLFRFRIGDWGLGYICPDCNNVVVPDPMAEKAGVTYFLTRRQFRERFGMEAPEIPCP